MLAAAGLDVVDEPTVDGNGSQEERLLRAMGDNFQKLQALHRALLDRAKSKTEVVEKVEADLEGRVAEAQDWWHQAQDELKATQGEMARRDLELTMRMADIEKAQETAKRLADEAAAVRSQHEAALKTQEEDLAAREEKLAATLRGKDEEVDKLVPQRTQDLERRPQEALNALAQAHAGKVKELEDQTLKLSQEKDTLNGALTRLSASLESSPKPPPPSKTSS